mgnify:FL=1
MGAESLKLTKKQEKDLAEVMQGTPRALRNCAESLIRAGTATSLAKKKLDRIAKECDVRDPTP